MANTNSMLTGSICLTDIPREMMKKVLCKDGVERVYLNISVLTRKEPVTFGGKDGNPRTYTHFVSCAPKKDDRKEGVNYIIGDLTERVFEPAVTPPSPQQVEQAPAAAPSDLPF